MASESGQNFSNHGKFTAGYHFVTAPLGIIYFIWSVRRLIAQPGADTVFTLIGAMAILGAIAYARTSPLVTQNRIIRLEERLRLTRILPADLAARVDEIRPGHLIALRFAPDAEVAELVRKVIADPSITPKAIKAQIKNWKGDYLRV
jgi:hypothetical protein